MQPQKIDEGAHYIPTWKGLQNSLLGNKQTNNKKKEQNSV